MTDTLTVPFTVGDILAYNTYGTRVTAAKVLDYTFVSPQDSDGRVKADVKYWVLQFGTIKNDSFVPNDASSDIQFMRTETVREYGFTFLWKKPTAFKDGQFLISDAGVVFYHQDKNTVWRVSGDDIASWGSMHASLTSRQKEHTGLKVLKTANGGDFKNIVK